MSIPVPRSVPRGTDCIPVGSDLLTRRPPAAMLRTKTAEGESAGENVHGRWLEGVVFAMRHSVRSWSAVACHRFSRAAGSPAQPSVFAGNRYWRGRKRWQATALQDRRSLGGNVVVCLRRFRSTSPNVAVTCSLGGNVVVCLRSGPYDGRKENSRRTVPESGCSSSAGAQHTACPHAARYDVHRIGEGSS